MSLHLPEDNIPHPPPAPPLPSRRIPRAPILNIQVSHDLEQIIIDTNRENPRNNEREEGC